MPHLPLLPWPEGALIIALCTEEIAMGCNQNPFTCFKHVLSLCMFVRTYMQQIWPEKLARPENLLHSGRRTRWEDSVKRCYKILSFLQSWRYYQILVEKITLGFFKLKEWGAVVGKRM